MTSSAFPDINVWVALCFAGHSHHIAARTWYRSLQDEDDIIFCRMTQLGLLRLLTHGAVMGTSVKTQAQAWSIYDDLLLDGSARLVEEPRSLDLSFRRLSSLDTPSPQHWSDSYLVAFAERSGMALVTFDKALASRVEGSILL